MRTRFLIFVAAVGAATTMLTPVPKAVAQENIDTYSCQYVGASATEPLGDREGHGLSTRTFTCLVTAGPLTGGVATAETIWEMDKPGGTLLAGAGVIRKPGATTVWQFTDGKSESMMSDGKVVGAIATGHARFVMAVGSAASLSGKTFTWTSKTTAPGQFSVEAKRD